MNPSGSGSACQSEAERWLDISKKLLAASDLIGSKRFAERALACDPLLPGLDQILAVCDVLLASQLRVNNQINYYSVLQLDTTTATSSTSTLSRHFRRLALLLSPDHNQLPFASNAFKIVSDAFFVLSDPSKKSLFDSELKIADAQTRSDKPDKSTKPDPGFWTACPSCCHVYQYEGAYEGLILGCQSCQRPFVAAAMKAEPPIVPGTNMYYCSWGFFPLGFPGGPGFGGGGWMPKPAVVQSQPSDRKEGRGKKGSVVSKKVVAKKKVGGGLNKSIFGAEAEKESGRAVGIDINEEVGGFGAFGLEGWRG